MPTSASSIEASLRRVVSLRGGSFADFRHYLQCAESPVLRQPGECGHAPRPPPLPGEIASSNPQRFEKTLRSQGQCRSDLRPTYTASRSRLKSPDKNRLCKCRSFDLSSYRITRGLSDRVHSGADPHVRWKRSSKLSGRACIFPMLCSEIIEVYFLRGARSAPELHRNGRDSQNHLFVLERGARPVHTMHARPGLALRVREESDQRSSVKSHSDTQCAVSCVPPALSLSERSDKSSSSDAPEPSVRTIVQLE